MTDLISRQAAVDGLNEYFASIGRLKRNGLNKGEKAIGLDTVGVIKTLPSAPTVEERPTGEWVLHNKNFKTLQYHTCSNCGARARTILTGTRLVDNYYCYKSEPITEYEFDEELSDFCPNCGARMVKIQR